MSKSRKLHLLAAGAWLAQECNIRMNVGSFQGCAYTIADAGVCTACSPSGDAMGNPSGTFVGVESDGEIFVRFPDAVAALTVPNGLADLIGFALFNIDELSPTGAPPSAAPLSQSFHVCNVSILNPSSNAAINPTGFTTISGWLRGLSLVPVMATSSFGNPPTITPSSSVSSNLAYLSFFIDDLDMENLSISAFGISGIQAGSAVLQVQVQALMEIQAVTLPGSSCADSFGLFAPDAVAVQFASQSPTDYTNPTVVVSAEASNGNLGLFGTNALQTAVQSAITSVLETGLTFNTPGFCITQAEVLAEPSGAPANPVGVANWVPDGGGFNGGPFELGPLPGGTTIPAAFLQLAGFVADAGDPPDPPPPPLQVTMTELAASIPIPPDAGPASDPPPLPVPAAGQPFEALGITYQALPGFVFEAALLSLSDGGVDEGLLAAPLWPFVAADVITTAFYSPAPGINIPEQIPDPASIQGVASSFDDLLEGTGIQQALWPISYGAYAGANEGSFFPYLGVSAEAVGRQAFTVGGPTGVTEVVYSCNSNGLGNAGVVTTDGGPIVGFPVEVSPAGAQIVGLNGFIGGVDGGLPPDPPLACGLNTTNCPLRGGGTTCVVTRVDPDNCGGCGVACGAGQVCTGGTCVVSTDCPQGRIACGSPATCVDPLTDSSFCSANGRCGSACAAGEGCAGGKCVATVAVSSTGPAYCQGNNGPLMVVQGDGGADCAGNLAQQASSNNAAVCSCAGGTLSQAMTTDSYNSLLGPYAAGGTAGNVLFNDAVTSSQVLTVGGNLSVGEALTLSSNGNLVDGNLFVGGALTVSGSLSVEQNALIDGKITGKVIVDGSSAGTQLPLCDCGNPIDIAGIVANGAGQNDNETIGLNSNVFANTSTASHLDLPCGAYYLTGIKASQALSISVHGSTVLYVGGNIQTSGPLEITVDPTAQLSLFVAGSISASSSTGLGSTEVPAQSSFYVGGAAGVSASNTLAVAGTLYVPNGPLKNSNSVSVHGSVLANGIDASGPIAAHLDQGLESAGAACSSVVATVSLSDFLPQTVIQEFSGPITIQAFVPSDPDAGTSDDPADAGPTTVPIPYVVITNQVGHMLGFQPAASVLPFNSTLCRGAQVVEQTLLPLTEFDACAACGYSQSPPAGGCCWLQREVVPAVLGVRDLLWDARQNSAPGQLYSYGGGIKGAIFGTPTATLGFGVTTWPGDPTGSYVAGPVGGNNGQGGFSAVAELFVEPQNDTIFVVGSTDRLITGVDAVIGPTVPPVPEPDAGLFSQQPIDVSCVIGAPTTFSGTTNSVSTVPLNPFTNESGVFNTALLNLAQYMDNPGDEVELFFQVPTLSDAGFDAGLVYEAAPGGLLPFEDAIGPGGGDECSFLNVAIASGRQPAYSTQYGLASAPGQAGSAIFTLFAQTQNGAGSGCGPTWARIDAVGWVPSSGPTALTPGVVLQRLGEQQAPLQSGSAWWTMVTPAAQGGLAFPLDLDEIMANGFQYLNSGSGNQIVPLAGGLSCAAAECGAGSFNDACCIASGSPSGLPMEGLVASGGVSVSLAQDQSCCSGIDEFLSATCN